MIKKKSSENIMNTIPEKNTLEEKREVYTKIIKWYISHVSIDKWEKEKVQRGIKYLTERKPTLSEYKKEIENAKDKSELLKVWQKILGDEQSGLMESTWYNIFNRHIYHAKAQIEENPERSKSLYKRIEKYTICKEMLIEGIDWLTVQGKWIEKMQEC